MTTVTFAAAPWALFPYALAVIVVVAGMQGLSYILGQRHQERSTGDPYESGNVPTGSARLRIPVKYYLVAVFFAVFDLEAAFLFAWAIAVREVGWAGFVEATVFIAVLAGALVYLWRQGALDWGPGGSAVGRFGGPGLAGVYPAPLLRMVQRIAAGLM